MNAKSVNFLILIVILQIFVGQSQATDKTFVWSVVPQFTGTAVHRDWTPLILYLEEKTGEKFKLRIYDSIPDFEHGFLKGEPDIAYMNPYHAVMAKKAQGYTPIIRNGKRLLTGIIVVRKDSSITNIHQLADSKVSFPSPNAFAASLYMRALLREKEKIEFTPVFAGTHSNAYRQTLVGQTVASGAVKRTLSKEPIEVQNNLKIIYTTPSFPSHPLVVHPRVAIAVKNTIQTILLKLHGTKQGKKLLNPVLLAKPVKANYVEEYLPLKSLNLETYLVVQ